jgi:hypothetical protein
MQHTRLKVDVAPFERQPLARAQTGRSGEEDHRPVSRAERLGDRA